jgi:putative spermidine/putrescine transport system substrate-binding protein
MTKLRAQLNRRSLLAGVALIAAPAVLGRSLARAQGRGLVIVSWGGTYAEAVETAFLKPFTNDTGVPVTVASGPDMARVRAQVRTGNIDWDLLDGPGPMITAGEREGTWEALDKSIVNMSDMVPGASRESAIGYYLYAGGIGFDPKRHPPGRHPTDFVELWDAQRFPGRRGLRTRVFENLEMALIADGVEPSKLYPLDVERAFNSMNRIKPHVTNWIAQTPQTIVLIQNNEVDFTFTYSGRVLAAQRSGISVDFSYKSTVNSMGYLAILKGTKNRDAAMRLVSYFARPDRQAHFSEIMAYSPSKTAAVTLLKPETQRLLPDLTSPNNAIIDDDWWADKVTELEKRFKEWQLS